jgi:hypothetical protein
VKSLVPGISVPHSGRCWINANFLELIQGGAASQEPYGKRVAEDHRRDPPHAHLFAALPDGILERFGGRHGTCCLSLLALRGLPDVPDQDARFASRKLADPTSCRGAETVSIMKHPASHREYPAIGSTSPLIAIFQTFLRLDRCEGSDVTPTCSLPQTTGRSFRRRPAVRARATSRLARALFFVFHYLL